MDTSMSGDGQMGDRMVTVPQQLLMVKNTSGNIKVASCLMELFMARLER